MTDRITPRTAIKGFLDVASISKSAISARTRRRRSVASTVTTEPVQVEKRKSQSFSEVTPRTLIQGVLATTEVAPDTARKRARTTPQPKESSAKKAPTPRTASRSTRKRSTRLNTLTTPGGSYPTPRTLIQGLVNAAPVETPWTVKPAVRRTSPRNKPDFPIVTEMLQGQAQGPSLSPYIKDPNSIQRPGRSRLRSGLRRAGTLNREQFAAGIAEKLSQEESSEDNTPETRTEPTSKEDSQVSGTILESIREEDQEEEEELTTNAEKNEEDEQVEEDKRDEDKEVDLKEGEEDNEDDLAGGDASQMDTQESSDPEFVPVSVSNQSENLEPELQSALAAASHEEDVDTAEQSTLEAEVITADLSAGGDADMSAARDADQSTRRDAITGDDEEEKEEEDDNDDDALMPTQPATASRTGDDEEEKEEEDDDDDDDALMPTQPATASRRSRGVDTMLATLQETDATTMIQTRLDDYSPLVTPKIAAGRTRKTPALKKTPAPRRAQEVPHRTSGVPKTTPAKKPAPRRQQRQRPELNTLPASLTKSIFAHFSKARVKKDALEAVVQGSATFFKRVSEDLVTYASHANRHTIEIADVELLMRRQGQITDKESLHSLIEKYLPMEYRQELIPVATSGNKVTPKSGALKAV